LSTKIALLLDECVPAPLATAIEETSGISSCEIISADHPLGNRGTPDYALVRYASENNRILVTIEKRLNEKLYAICTHSGIIVLQCKTRFEPRLAGLFKSFMKSGHRMKSYHAVTKLRLGESERLQLGSDGTVETVLLTLDS
jgi:predicted nuclease of predicted toxin-antitoxin system